MYTNKPLLGRTFANSNAMTCWDTQGAFAIPKGNTLNLHFVTKAVLFCLSTAKGIRQYAFCMSHTVMNLASPTVSMCASALGIGQIWSAVYAEPRVTVWFRYYAYRLSLIHI